MQKVSMKYINEFKELVDLLTLPFATRIALKELAEFDDIARDFEINEQKITYVFKLRNRSVHRFEIKLSDLETDTYRVFDYAVKRFLRRISDGRKKNV